MATTSGVYINVIEDVVNKVRDDFLQSNVDESILHELRGLWEMKMMQYGAILGPIERSSVPKLPTNGATGVDPTPVHDLNVPYEPTEDYETPTAKMLFPPMPLQTPMQTLLPGTAHTHLLGTVQTPLPRYVQTPLPGSGENLMYQLPTPSDYSSGHESVTLNEVKLGMPSQYMQTPSPWMNQRPLGVDVNVAYVEGWEEGERGNPPQPTTQISS